MAEETRIIKKYANRRLYDTAESRYVALDDIRRLVLAGEQFKVIDARSGDDITRSILLQIIVEQEETGQSMLSTQLLEQIILYYGSSLQTFVRAYLEKSMESFIGQQQALQDQMETMLRMTPPSILKDMTEQNLKLWKTLQKKSAEGLRRRRRRNRSGRGSGRLIEGYITARSLPACHKRETPGACRTGRSAAPRGNETQ